MAYDVTFIPGAGTGPELTQATRRTGVELRRRVRGAGLDEHPGHRDPFAEAALASPREAGGSSSCPSRMNPTALAPPAVHMLDQLKETAGERALERVIAPVVRKGERVTYDLKSSRTDPTAAGRRELAGAVIEEMNA